jgi:hypothetical protein
LTVLVDWLTPAGENGVDWTLGTNLGDVSPPELDPKLNNVVGFEPPAENPPERGAEVKTSGGIVPLTHDSTIRTLLKQNYKLRSRYIAMGASGSNSFRRTIFLPIGCTLD